MGYGSSGYYSQKNVTIDGCTIEGTGRPAIVAWDRDSSGYDLEDWEINNCNIDMQTDHGEPVYVRNCDGITVDDMDYIGPNPASSHTFDFVGTTNRAITEGTCDLGSGGSFQY